VRRIAVTGIGLLSVAGRGLRAHTDALNERQLPSFAPVRGFETSDVPVSPVAQVDDALFERAAADSRTDALALAAAVDAVEHSGQTAPAGGILVLGTTTGGIDLSESEYLRASASRGLDKLTPSLGLSVAERSRSPVRSLHGFRRHPAGAVTDRLATRLGLSGERQTFSTACSSSANAIGYAAMRLDMGAADWALAGGVDALCRLTYFGFHSLRLLSPAPCMPFHVKRSGLSLGEGAAFVVLEAEERALARGARIWGFLRGWGCSADAHHLTAPDPQGLGAAAAMRSALNDAGLELSAIEYLNAHGTGTPANDVAESLAVSSVFGDSPPRVSSTKGLTGHTLGASGALEAALSWLAMADGVLPRTLRLDAPDPKAALPHIQGEPLRQSVRFAMSTSFGFGGNNAALVLERGTLP
jgi:3-oxoacyl-[acyl-carrier-protein] synthase II